MESLADTSRDETAQSEIRGANLCEDALELVLSSLSSCCDNESPDIKQTESIRRPCWISLSIVLLNCSLGVTSFLIVLPTSANYTSSFGINDQLAGLLVGLSPLINGLVQPLLIPIFQRFSLRHIFYANCFLTMLGNTLYALGDVANSFGVLLLGRCVLGISGGPAFATTYTARATSDAIRTQYMGFTAVSVSSGYVFGPLLAFVSERVVNVAQWDSQLLNSNTVPGWIIVVLAFFNFLLFLFLFEEPPRADSDSKEVPTPKTNQVSDTSSTTPGAVEEDEGEIALAACNDEAIPNNDGKTKMCCGLKGMQIALCYLLIAVTMANTGSFEISLVFRGESDWDFSIGNISLMLAAFNVITIALSFLQVEKFVSSDQKGILFCFLGLLVATPFLFDFHGGLAGEISIFGIGGILLLFSAQTAKGFLYGLASKVPSPEHQQMVMSFMATAYTFGRFAGTLVAPFLLDYSHAYGGFLLGLNFFCCVLFTGFYRFATGEEGTG